MWNINYDTNNLNNHILCIHRVCCFTRICQIWQKSAWISKSKNFAYVIGVCCSFTCWLRIYHLYLLNMHVKSCFNHLLCALSRVHFIFAKKSVQISKCSYLAYVSGFWCSFAYWFRIYYLYLLSMYIKPLKNIKYKNITIQIRISK